MHDCYFEYYEANGTRFFNVILKPEKEGKFPIILWRSPYVDQFESEDESVSVKAEYESFKPFVDAGFAVIAQHCRGRGKSGGDCIPYIYEREDSNAMLDWVRTLPFYDGRIYLKGSSYCTSVWYAAAPYADDIKGALFAVQISDRYNVCYTNGFLKKGLHGYWYINRMYKYRSHKKRNYAQGTLDTLPLTGITKEVFGEYAEDFEELIKHPDRGDDFWNTRFGGADARDAEKKAKFPMLFVSSWYDIYTGGMFDLWYSLSEESRKQSAFAVSAYNHGDTDGESPIKFKNGSRNEQFPLWDLKWFSYLENGGESPFELGKITYFTLFEDEWRVCERLEAAKSKKITLGQGIAEYTYNPFCPPEFVGGLSRNFGATGYQRKAGARYDIITVYSEPFENDVTVKGKIAAKLKVSTDRDDTCFLVRVSIEKEGGDYGLRDDITSVVYQHPDYIATEWAELDFSMDEIALQIKKGERLRIDVASADDAHYVRHTNNKGLFSTQTTAKIAHNKVDLGESYILIPIE